MDMDGRDHGQDGTQSKSEDWESTVEAEQQRDSGGEANHDEFELDLEVDDIETRLPYGSEDIADK